MKPQTKNSVELLGTALLCPHCGSERTKKNGFNKGQTQYFCNFCGKYFQKNLLKLLQKDQILHSGLDFLRFYITSTKFHCFCKTNLFYTDSDNTNETKIRLFNMELQAIEIDTDQGRTYMLNYDGSPIMQWTLLSTKQKKFIGYTPESNVYKISVYGRFFALMRLGIVPESLIENFNRYQPELTRVDYCLDVLGFTPEQSRKFFYSSRTPSKSIFGQDGELETIYFGRTSIKENRRLLIRLYDKKRDIVKKKKMELYADYLAKSEPVTRVEFEIRNETLKEHKMAFEDVFNLFKFQAFMQAITHTKHRLFAHDFSFLTTTAYRKEHREATLEYLMPRLASLLEQTDRLGFTREELLNSLRTREASQAGRILECSI